MSKTQLLGEELAIRMALRFSVPGMAWGFGRVLESVPMDEWKNMDLELLELYALVLMPVALVNYTSGKVI